MPELHMNSEIKIETEEFLENISAREENYIF